MGGVCVGEVENYVIMKTILIIIVICLFNISANSQLFSDTLELISQTGHLNWINNVKLKGDILYTGGMDKSLKLWDIRSSKELASISPSEDVLMISIRTI